MLDYVVPITNDNLIESVKERPSFEQLVEIFMANKDLKPTSVKSYLASFHQFAIYLKNKGVSFVTERDIKEFKDYLLGKNLSVFTIISHLSALKSLFSFTANRNLYPLIKKTRLLEKNGLNYRYL